MLGLITTKKPRWSGGGSAARIEEAARIVPLERLALSPQCGFASTEAGNALSEGDQAAKLRLVAEVARDVWAGLRTAQAGPPFSKSAGRSPSSSVMAFGQKG